MKSQLTVTKAEDKLTHIRPVRVWTWAFDNLDKTVSYTDHAATRCAGEVFTVHDTPTFPPHDHDHYELELIVAGSAFHQTDEGITKMEAGDVHIVAPGEVHSLDQIDGLHVVHCAYIGEWLATDMKELLSFGDLVSLFLPTILFNKAKRVRVPQWMLTPKQLWTCLSEMRDIAEECNSQQPSSHFLKWTLKKLMVHLYRSFHEWDSSALLPLREEIRRAVQEIEKHVHDGEPFDAAALAIQFKMNPTTFSRTFKEYTGFSPMQYFQRRRVERAAWLLRDANYSVTTIAHELGYSDASHFARVFRQRYGCTPIAFSGRLSNTITE